MNTLSLPLPATALDTGHLGSISATPGAAMLTVASDLLLRGRRVIQIEHNGVLYQLRATKLGKLILTK